MIMAKVCWPVKAVGHVWRAACGGLGPSQDVQLSFKLRLKLTDYALLICAEFSYMLSNMHSMQCNTGCILLCSAGKRV